MELKIKLQRLFKKTFQKLFIFFYGRIFYKENYNFLKENSANEIRKIYIDNLEYNCLIINNGVLYTDLVESVAVVTNNNLIPKANFQKVNNELVDDYKNVSLTKGTPRIRKKIDKTVVSLIQDASGKNYAHWLLDILPKLEILNKTIPTDTVDYFLLPELKYNFQYETLKILGIPTKKILNTKFNRHIKAKKLIIIDHPWYSKGTVHDEMINIHEWIIKWLRKKFLEFSDSKTKDLKLFIDRSDSIFNHCKLINANDVWNLLKKNGFQKLKLSSINFQEQVNLFNSADTIVGAHGAGLANTIFSKANTKIIEIKPKNHNNQFIKKISKVNNLNHKIITSNDIKLKDTNLSGDINVNIEELQKNLDSQ